MCDEAQSHQEFNISQSDQVRYSEEKDTDEQTEPYPVQTVIKAENAVDHEQDHSDTHSCKYDSVGDSFCPDIVNG